MSKYTDLYIFIDSAIKNRKYSPNTAGGHKAALKLFEKELNEKELESIDLVKENIEAIYANVSRNNGGKISAESLSTYKLRVLKVIEDYKKYGVDPTKITEWVSRTRKVSVRSNGRINDKTSGVVESQPEAVASTKTISGSPDVYEFAIRPGIVISIPKDISKAEASIIKALVDTTASNSERNEETDGQ